MSIPKNDKKSDALCWIGLAEVIPRAKNSLFKKCAGAFVPCVGLASDENNFFELVKHKLDAWHFDVLEIEDIEPLSKRLRKHTLEKSMIDAVGQVSEQSPIAFGELYIFNES